MRVVFSFATLLTLSACSAQIPNGVVACESDNFCPTGFVCRHEGKDPNTYCFDTGETDPVTDAGKDDAATGPDTGMDSGSDAGTDSGTDADVPIKPLVTPTTAAFSTLGGSRTDGTLTLHDDGFEGGERLCTTNQQFCVTGSFTP